MTRQPHPPLTNHEALRRRFDRYVRRMPNGCWEWQGSRNQKGYGTVGCNSRSYKAHRVAYELATGEWPGANLICHHCDNPGCVNPAHLFVGTPRDNMQDKVRKGRHATAGLDRHAWLEIFGSQIKPIRDMKPNMRVVRVAQKLIEYVEARAAEGCAEARRLVAHANEGKPL